MARRCSAMDMSMRNCDSSRGGCGSRPVAPVAGTCVAASACAPEPSGTERDCSGVTRPSGSSTREARRCTRPAQDCTGCREGFAILRPHRLASREIFDAPSPIHRFAMAVACLALVQLEAEQGRLGYYRFPAIWHDTIVFTAEGDLWRCQSPGASPSG